MAGNKKSPNKYILLAVDESENARRAVSYVAEILGGVEDFEVTIMHVIPLPEEDFFLTVTDKEKWLSQYRVRIDTVLKEYRQILIDAGFHPNNVSVRSPTRYCPSMAECILAERDEREYGTIVVGRQGLSRTEEFIFGSISSKIVTHARNCTVWVVE
jgi:nucleotide-binding universal stress UspA family protein